MTRPAYILFVAAAVVATCSHPIGAQQLDSLRIGILSREVGSEVRVTTASQGYIRGRLLEVTADTLRIDQGTGSRVVPFSSRDTLWTRERLGRTAAGYGAVAGLAGAGGVLVLLSSMCGSGDDPCTGFAHAALVLGTTGVLMGTVAGAVVGELIDHWVRKTPYVATLVPTSTISLPREGKGHYRVQRVLP